MACVEAEIDARHGSEVSVQAEKSINAIASSGARVRVYGTDDRTKSEESSGGKVNFR